MGSFGSAHGGVNTPETQQADNDLAVGKMVEAVANSPYANDTLIFVIEDDCQDGPDHVDSHRTTTYVVGPYVRKEAVISAPYTQVNVLRTIEDILGIFSAKFPTPISSPWNRSNWKSDSSTTIATPVARSTTERPRRGRTIGRVALRSTPLTTSWCSGGVRMPRFFYSLENE
jgi:hypothetical protein